MYLQNNTYTILFFFFSHEAWLNKLYILYNLYLLRCRTVLDEMLEYIPYILYEQPDNDRLCRYLLSIEQLFFSQILKCTVYIYYYNCIKFVYYNIMYVVYDCLV